MKTIFTCAATAALLAVTPAMATTPVISGKYIVTITKLCQMVDTYHFSSATQESIGNYLDSIATSGSSFKQSMYAATFSPTKGTVATSGFDSGGDVEIFHLTGTQNVTFGNTIAQTTNSGKVAYSNTDTTVTLGGQTYSAMFGQVKKATGIAGYVAFQGAFAGDSGNMCTEQGVIQAQ